MGRHTTHDYQRELVAAWSCSRQSAAAFARVHGVRPGTFYTWIARHRQASTDLAALATFVEIDSRSEAFVVHVGPHALAFAEPPPAAWFADLVRELGSC
jgi:transposase-like protein